MKENNTKEVFENIFKELNLCGCIGPINGEPYCPCKMAKINKSKSNKIYDENGKEIGYEGT